MTNSFRLLQSTGKLHSEKFRVLWESGIWKARIFKIELELFKKRLEEYRTIDSSQVTLNIYHLSKISSTLSVDTATFKHYIYIYIYICKFH